MEVEDRMHVGTAEKDGWANYVNDAGMHSLKLRMAEYDSAIIDFLADIKTDIEERGLLNLEPSDIPPVVLEENSEEALRAMQAALYRGDGLRRAEPVSTPIHSNSTTPIHSSGSSGLVQPIAIASRPGSAPGSAVPSRQGTPGAYPSGAPATATIHVQQQQQQAIQMAQTIGVNTQAHPLAVMKQQMPATTQYGVASTGIPQGGLQQAGQRLMGVQQQPAPSAPQLAATQGARFPQGVSQAQPMPMSAATQQQMRMQMAAMPGQGGRGVPPNMMQGGAINPNMMHRGQLPPSMVPSTPRS